MKQNKSAKRSLLFSVLSLLLCCTMLAGTTFAWFTDSVTSGNNKIVAGNLDLEVEYSNNGKDWFPMTETSELFDNDALWEPGYTTAVALRVKNVGNLAFKYSVSTVVYSETESTNVLGEKFKLSDYLVVKAMNMGGDKDSQIFAEILAPYMIGTRDQAQSMGETIEFGQTFVNDALVMAGADAYVLLSITLPTTVGNEANYDKAYEAPSIEFGVNVVATQESVEKDNFDEKYDDGADYVQSFYSGKHTLNDTLIASAANADAVLVNGVGTELTITGGLYDGGDNGSTTAVYAQDGAVVTIKDGTFLAGDGCAAIYARGEGTVVNIEGGFFKVDGPYLGTYFVLNLKDNTGAKINVTGGTFVNFNPADNKSENPAVSFVADGYCVISEVQPNGDVWYTVVEGTAANDVADLSAALASGQKVVLNSDVAIADTASRLTMNGGSLNGNGKTITYSGGQLTNMSAPVITTKGGSISNLTVVAPDGRALYVTTLTENLYVANCVLDGSYSFNYNSSTETNYTLNFSNTVFKSWVSYANVVKVANFEDCVFEGNLRPYADTVLANCQFTSTGTLDLLKLASGETITLTGCTQNGAALTVDMIKAMQDGADLANYTFTEDAGVITITRYDAVANDVADLSAALTTGGQQVALNNDVAIADSASRLTMNGGSFDGNGNTITYNGGMLTTGTSTMSAPVLTTKGGSVSNLTVVAPDGRALYVTTLTEDLYVANCVLDGSYAFNLNSSTVTNYTINFSNTVFKSWVSYANVVTVANFENCTFEGNLRAYGDTVLTNCQFNGDGTLDLSKLVAGETITLTGCTNDGAALTVDMIKTMQDGADLANYTIAENAGVITITRN